MKPKLIVEPGRHDQAGLPHRFPDHYCPLDLVPTQASCLGAVCRTTGDKVGGPANLAARRGSGGVHAVTAGRLGLVEGRVGARQQLPQVSAGVVGLIVCQAYRDGDLQIVDELQRPDRSPQPLGHQMRLSKLQPVKDHNELLATEAAEPVVAT